jgi:hypothetical protein
MIEQLEKECWSLDISLATVILPKLLYFKNWVDRYGVPSDFIDDVEGWNEVLDEMVWSFTYVSQDYPSRAMDYIEDVEYNSYKDTKLGYINVIYSNKDKYKEELEKDKINNARAQRGLALFAKYFTELWN